MKAKGRTPADGRVLLTTAEDKNYETQVEIRTGNGNVAGLILYYNEKAYAGVVSDGKTFYIYRDAEHKTELPNRIGKHFFMLCVSVCFLPEKEVRVSAASVIGMRFRKRKI